MSHEGYGPLPGPAAHGGVGYFCPRCQGMEIGLDVARVIHVAGSRMAECRLCKWVGTEADLIGALAPQGQAFWTPERVANALLIGASKHAAGPMVQLLEFIGLVPKIEGGEEERRSATEIRELVIKAVLEAVVTSSFAAAGGLTPLHYQRFRPELMAALREAIEGEAHG